MRHVLFVAILAALILVPERIIHAQVCAQGPLAGNVVGYRARITDGGNTCACNTLYTGLYTLHLVDSDQPGLRLTNNYSSGTCSGDIHGDLAIARPMGPVSSNIQTINDFMLIADATANNLLLTNKNGGGGSF